MTTPTREQVMEWAGEAGAIQLHKEGWDTVIQGGIGDMQRFAVLAMEAGRDQGLREAKEVAANKSQSVIACNTSRSTKRTNQTALFAAGLLDDCAAAIEQLRGD